MTGAATGDEARDRGVDDVLAAATAVHRAQALESLREALDAYIDAGEPFTADDVRHLAGDPDLHHPNVLSALFAGAVSAGRIRQVGNAIRTSRRSRHGGLVRRWEAARPSFPQRGVA